MAADDDTDVLRRQFDEAVDREEADPLATLAMLIAKPGRANHEVLDLKGRIVGPWRLERLIGVGGMGATYAATAVDGADATEIGCSGSRGAAAIKVMADLDETRGARFETEAHLLRGLDHPGIVRYLGHGRDGELGWLAMALVDAPTLADVLDELATTERPVLAASRAILEGVTAAPAERFRHPTVRQRLIRVIAKLAEAVAAAHRRGVLHLDLKPANVLVGGDLEPVCIDFGLSRDVQRGVSLTRTAAVMGTVMFMAPEQLGGRSGKVSTATDVFAIGCILHRVVTGLDARDDSNEVLTWAKRPFLLKSLPPTLPRDVVGVLYGALDPRPERRYADAAAMAIDLFALIGRGHVARRPPNLIALLWRRRAAKALICLVVLAGAIARVPALEADRPHILTIATRTNGGRVTIEGEGVRESHALPTPAIDVRPGSYRVTINGPYGEIAVRTIVVPRDRFRSHLTIVDLSKNADLALDVVDAARDRLPGETDAYLAVAVGDPTAKVTVDGVAIDEKAHWIALQSGRHSIVAASRDGTSTESQTVTIEPGAAQYLVLLSARTAGLKAAFRRTLGLACSPLPDGLSLRLDDGVAVTLANVKTARGTHVGFLNVRSLIGPLVKCDEPLAASVVVDFDAPMRTAIVEFHADAVAPATLELSWRTDDGPFRVLQQRPGDDHHWLAVTSNRPFRRLEVRGRMTSPEAPQSTPFAQFLVADGDSHRPGRAPRDTTDDAFAVIADPAYEAFDSSVMKNLGLDYVRIP